MPINDSITGDLIELAEDGKFFGIVHGCNCFHRMGSGIAKQIKQKFPMAEIADKNHSVLGDPSKLGSYTKTVYTLPKLYKTNDPNKIIDLTIINGYTQYFYGTNERHVCYEAIGRLFSKLNEDFSFLEAHKETNHYMSTTFGIPLIGAGLAGGNWEIILGIINAVTPNLDITSVVYDNS